MGTYYQDEFMSRERIGHYLHEAEQNRRARQLERRPSLDLRCRLSARVYYVAALCDRLVRRMRHVLPAGEATPALAECR